MGEDISEQLEIIPATLSVIQHVRKKYACKSCEETIKSAPRANVLLPKAIASNNTMAYIITAKYAGVATVSSESDNAALWYRLFPANDE